MMGLSKEALGFKLKCIQCRREFSASNSNPHAVRGFCKNKCMKKYDNRQRILKLTSMDFKTTNTKNVQPVRVTRYDRRPTANKNSGSLKARKSNGDFYRSQEWLELRFKVLMKYGRTCMACGDTKGSMHVDHIVPRSKNPSLELRFDNLQVLCKACNFGKKNKWVVDFRPEEPSDV